MAEHSGFFDANFVDGQYDRVYLADDFAKYYRSFISDGYFRGTMGELEVLQKDNADMSVRIAAGQGFIKGYFYENDEELLLSIENADGVLNRIDIVVLRLDMSQRAINLAIKKGVAAANPSAPDLTRAEDLYELKLADIYVNAGATNIVQSNIIDTRLITDYCGMVTFVGEGNISNMTSDIEKLKSIMVESTLYPGCYYRVVNNVVEWINPPDVVGVEYKLSERWNGKALYQKAINIASLPNSSIAYIDTGTAFLNMIFINGYAYNATNGQFFPFPVYLEGKSAPSAVINKMDPNGYVLLTTVEDMTAYNAEIIIKYTK